MVHRTATLGLLAGIAMIATHAAEAGPPQHVTSVEGIHEFVLDNGLRVLLFPDPSKPQVTVNLTVFVGSRHEGYGEAGMAHLLEHMLFKGTPDHPNIPKVLKDHGAEFNGTTWLDRTNYYETLPASPENLEFAIRLEADRMVNSYVKAEDLASEMTVVRNEFERGENSPTSILGQRMMSAAFQWHNYGQSTIGNRADIERVPIQNLQAFYRRYYQPDNAMLVIAGQFDPEQALSLAEKYFGALPAPERELPSTYTEEPAQDGERLVTLRRVGELALCGAIYHICSGAHPDYVPLDVLEHILTSSPSGRLYKALVETKRAASVSGAAYALHDPGVLRFMVDVSPGNDPRDVLASLTEIVETIGEEGVTEEEVERAKRYWMKTWEMAMNDSSRLAIQLSEWAAQGDWRLIFLYRDRLEAVTPEMVNAVAKKYLRRNNRTAGLFVPTTSPERVKIPETPKLAEMIGDYKGREGVAVGEAFEVTPENIDSRTERVKLKSGVDAAFIAKKTRGATVHVRLKLHFGTVESLAGRGIACEMLPALMTRGTKSLSRQELQDALDQNRARLVPSGGPGEAAFHIETRREFLPNVLGLLQQVLREPTLPEEEFDVIRNKKVAGLEQQQADPTALARVEISRLLNHDYPSDDPRYVATIDEELERWNGLSIDQVREIYEQFLNGTHGEIAIVGDFEPTEVQPLLEEMFHNWTSSEPYVDIPQIGDVDVPATRLVIQTPDKENAIYLGGSVFPMRSDAPDYPALVMGNHILGSSGLASRLGDRVRQKEGLSYGVGSFLRASTQHPRTTFLAYAITNPTNMPKVETAIREEIERLLKEGVTAEELSAAQQGYLERLTVERSDDSELTRILVENLELDRTMEFYQKQEQRVAELTTDDVMTALRKYISLKHYAVVVAGDFMKSESAAESPAGTEE